MATMCQNHPDVKATFIGTVLEPQVVAVAVCDECMPLFCAAVFEEMTGVDMSPALYLASEEGQANPNGPGVTIGDIQTAEVNDPAAALAAAGDNGGAATIREIDAARGAPTDEPPAPGPADADTTADPTSGAAETEDDSAAAPAPAGASAASSESESPPKTGTEDQAAGV